MGIFQHIDPVFLSLSETLISIRNMEFSAESVMSFEKEGIDFLNLLLTSNI